MKRANQASLPARKTPGPTAGPGLSRFLPLALITAAGSVIYLLATWNHKTVDDPALGMPAQGAPDLRFSALSPWDAAAVPIATGFESPVGSRFGALFYNARPFGKLNPQRGGHHSGEDLEGIGGGNSDLGEPVFAAADGLVLFAANPSPDHGNTIILAHRLPDGRPIRTIYAHLHSMTVKPGDLVGRGQEIGLVGTADGRSPAHLHYEMRESHGIDLSADYPIFFSNHLDPEKITREFPANPPDRPAPSVLETAVREPDANP